jgi:hypothetical protein
VTLPPVFSGGKVCFLCGDTVSLPDHGWFAMRTFTIIAICAVILGAAVANTAGAGKESVADAKITDLAWLAGYWMSDKRGMLAEECWLPPEGGLMLGLHRDALEDGNIFFEYLRIMETGDGIVYYATPQGYDTTKFKLTALSWEGNSAQAVFENPDHDYPQLIRYMLIEGGLRAEIEGTEDDEKVKSVWVWQRADFPRNRNSTR